MPDTEAALTKRVRAWLSTQPDVWTVKHSGGAFTTVGVPDLLLCVRGRFVAIELKAPRGVPTKLQVHQIGLIHKAGGVAAVCRSLDEVKAVLVAVE